MTGADATHRMLADSVRRGLEDTATPAATVAAEREGLDRASWARLRELGLVGPDAAALALREHAAIATALGETAALVPFVDSEALARWVASGAGLLTRDDETLAVVSLAGERGDAAGLAARLRARSVKWGRHADRVVVVVDEGAHAFAGLIDRDSLRFAPGSNLAGEPLDRCGVDSIPAISWSRLPASHGPGALQCRGALLRVAAMLGAATRLQSLTIEYAGDRRQFGKSLSQFQVIQSHLAAQAGEIAAVGAMLETAIAAAEAAEAAAAAAAAAAGPAGAAASAVAGATTGDRDAPKGFGVGTDWDGAEIAAAKVRAGVAVQALAGIAHQVHGAIGFTREHSLHLFSRRLWAWREEYGNDAHWSGVLGAALIALGPEGFWRRIAR